MKPLDLSGRRRDRGRLQAVPPPDALGAADGCAPDLATPEPATPEPAVPEDSPCAEQLAREAIEQALDAGGDGFALFESETVNGLPRLRLLHGNAVAQGAFDLAPGDHLAPCLAPRPAARIWGLLWEAVLRPEALAARPGDVPLEGGVAGRHARAPVPGAWDVTVAPAGPRRAVVTWRDSTGWELARQRLEETLRTPERTVTHDAVTGLPGSALLRAHLSAALAGCRRGRRIGVVVCTLDGLAGSATARYGVDVGEGLLRATADRLRGFLHAGDVAGRIGDDTFALVLTWPSHSTDPMRLTGRVADQVGRPLAVRSTLLAPVVSVGVALADPTRGPDGDRDADAMLRRAVEAMHRSKVAGHPVVADENDGDAELARVAALSEYDLDDGALDDVFGSAVRLAAAACDAPYALVSVVETDLVWVRSSLGADRMPGSGCAPRHLALCDVAVRRRELLVLPDLQGDARCASRHVGWQDGIAFYAGAPLVDREGRAIGALAVMDDEPRDLTPLQRRTLTTLAQEITNVLEARRVRRP